MNAQRGFAQLGVTLAALGISGLTAVLVGTGWARPSAQAQVSEGFILSRTVTTAVAEYYAERGTLPTSNQEAGVAPPAEIDGSFTRSVRIAGDHSIRVTFARDTVSPSIRDRTLTLFPVVERGTVTWRCGGDIPSADLPAPCNAADGA